jgi:hypothetical protein
MGRDRRSLIYFRHSFLHLASLVSYEAKSNTQYIFIALVSTERRNRGFVSLRHLNKLSPTTVNLISMVEGTGS